jgi:hypothetical protein
MHRDSGNFSEKKLRLQGNRRRAYHCKSTSSALEQDGADSAQLQMQPSKNVADHGSGRLRATKSTVSHMALSR